MSNWLSRQNNFIGENSTQRLKSASVAVLGLGGVGGACVEALVRCGIGRLILLDRDTVDITNLNRQLLATLDNVGISKCTAAYERVLSINPNCKVDSLEIFYEAQTAPRLFSLSPDFVIDAIDTVSSKLHLAQACQEHGVPLVSCLGTGNRLDPSQFTYGDISDTAGCGCGLARVMRRECRKRGIKRLTVVYSTEPPYDCVADVQNGRHAPGSISYCPPVAGYLLASLAVRHLLKCEALPPNTSLTSETP